MRSGENIDFRVGSVFTDGLDAGFHDIRICNSVGGSDICVCRRLVARNFGKPGVLCDDRDVIDGYDDVKIPFESDEVSAADVFPDQFAVTLDDSGKKVLKYSYEYAYLKDDHILCCP